MQQKELFYQFDTTSFTSITTSNLLNPALEYATISDDS